MSARTLAIALVLATASAKIGNVDCGNGNMCPERMTCASPHHLSAASPGNIVGRKYGCAPFPHASLCPGHRFSCPTGTKCLRSKEHGDLSCVSAGAAPKKPTQNVNALATPAFLALAPKFAPGNGFCAIIGDDLPSECTCKDDSASLGGTIDCQEDVVVDTVGLTGTITPCGGEAEAKLTIYETDIGFSYSKGIAAGEEIAQFPIPGLSVDVPIVGSCGVYAGLSFKGDASALTLSGTLDVCGSVLGVTECGSSIYSGLPIDVIDGTWDFSDICTGPSPGPSPSTDDDPTPPGPSPGPAGTTHYGDPANGCLSDEHNMSVTGLDGDFCAPACDSSGSCPTDVPSGVTATPTCALQDSSGNKNCALICSPSLPIRDQKAADAQCGSNASCKSIQSTGICTYDDGSSSSSSGGAKLAVKVALSTTTIGSGKCVCKPDKPCQQLNDGSCGQRVDDTGKPVAVGGQCAAGTEDCRPATDDDEFTSGSNDACSESTQSACDAASGCTWCKCAALPSKCWTKEDAAKLPAGVYVCDSTQPTFLRGAKVETA